MTPGIIRLLLTIVANSAGVGARFVQNKKVQIGLSIATALAGIGLAALNLV